MTSAVESVLRQLVLHFVPRSLSSQECSTIARRTLRSLDRIPFLYRIPVFLYLILFNWCSFFSYRKSFIRLDSDSQASYLDRSAPILPGWGSLSKLLRTLVLLNADYS